MTNLAFHNDATLAAQVRAQVDAHTAADEIIQGKYWENGKGCFIGCIAHGNNPSIVEAMTGFPLILTKIAESIFEGLPASKAKRFPQQVINAPRIGADLSLVAWKFLHCIVTDAVTKFADEKTQKACEPAVSILLEKSMGKIITADAAVDAARAAAYAAARAAARAAVDAAADAARAAADAARIEQAKYLVQLLEEA